MNRVHVIGYKNSGKTGLVVGLVTELRLRGVRVGTIKHTSHVHVLDRPGTDSYRHRAAGAETSAIVTPDSCGVFRRLRRYDAYELLESDFARCEIVLVEGDRHADAPKVEVWRRGSEELLRAATEPDISAVVTDVPTAVAKLVPDGVIVVSRSNIGAVADVVMSLAGTSRRGP